MTIDNFPMASVGVMQMETDSSDRENLPMETKDENIQTKESVPAALTSMETEKSSESADLEKAIALSLELSRMHNIDKDNMTRALQQSMAAAMSNEDKSVTERNNPTCDPHKRKRRDMSWPVGICNVGNTCWFSAVIQPLYHLPLFRNMILSFKPKPSENCSANMESGIIHLKELFALMTCSPQSHINPSQCLRMPFLQHTSRTQQDASEFTHKLLDYLEEIFKNHPQCENHETNAADVASATATTPKNPIVELFYGQYTSVGHNGVTKQNPFGLLPLLVDKVHNLHDSIENTLSHDIVVPGEEQFQTTSHEGWFSSLPPVLTFELSRFHYNQTSNKAEKIHSRLDFPLVIYMDRYMDTNIEVTREKRNRCHYLKKELQMLKTKLISLTSCEVGNGESSHLPVKSVLEQCAKFAADRINSTAVIESDVEMSPHKKSRQEEIEDEEVAQNKEASLVEKNLRKWIEEVKVEEQEIKEKIMSLEAEVDFMYEDGSLKIHPYILHAVVVHQGHALAGHYWVFVYNHCKKAWKKLNDESVTQSSFDEVLRDSVGGKSYTFETKSSAYCLMYVDSHRQDVFKEEANSNVTRNIIENDVHLNSYIAAHNQKYEQDLEEWDLQRAAQLSLEKNPTSNTTDDLAHANAAGDHAGRTALSSTKKSHKENTSWHYKACEEAIAKVSKTVAEKGPEAALEQVSKPPNHLLIYGIEDYTEDALNPSFQSTMSAISGVQDIIAQSGEESALLQAVKNEWMRLQELSLHDITLEYDTRLEHIAIYLFKNCVARKVIERAILEQFGDNRLSYDNDSVMVMKCAKRKLRQLSNDSNTDEYENWLKYYTMFNKSTCSLVKAMELVHCRCYEEAIPYLINVHKLNRRILRKFDEEVRSRLGAMIANQHVAMAIIRECVQHINDDSITLCTSQNVEDCRMALDKLKKFITPSVHILQEKSLGGNTTVDMDLVENIRSVWCTVWGRENVSFNMDVLSDAMQNLIDSPYDCLAEAQFKAPPTIHPSTSQSLCQRYTTTMRNVAQFLHLADNAIPSVYCAWTK